MFSFFLGILLSEMCLQSVTTTDCKASWLKNANTMFCYLIQYDNVNWLEAEEHCKKLGGHLVSIHSKEEQGFIQGKLQYMSWFIQAWIGVSYKRTKGIWTWSDNSTVDFQYWNTGLHGNNVDEEQCVVLSSTMNYTWTILNCELDQAYIICKKPYDTTLRNETNGYTYKSLVMTNPTKDSSIVISTTAKPSRKLHETTSRNIHLSEKTIEDKPVITEFPENITEKSCFCPGEHFTSPHSDFTMEEREAIIEAKIKELKEELTVKHIELSSTVRRKTSAPDDRKSAKAMGLTLGVALLTVVFGSIFIADLPIIWRQIRGVLHVVCNRC